ncbi:MAG: glycosyl transferase, partial [Anaerolineae bacterium]
AQLDADGLLLITAPGQRSVATLKLFDYIGAGVPILALAADNAAAAIVTQYGLGLTVAPDDAAAIQRTLHELAARQQAGAVWPGFAAAQLRFERRQLTGQLAAVFRDVVKEA